MSETHLSDAAVRDFITHGYTLVQSGQSPEFHRDICRQLDEIIAGEGNPGNNVLPLIPGIQEVFESPAVRGALESLLGPNFAMHPHRYCHDNRPGSAGQEWHKDDYVYDQNVRHHRFRWVMAFYYPQDVSSDMGPTGIMPGRQYYNHISSADAAISTEEELKLCGPAGTVAVVNFDSWHRATANSSDKERYMLKFQFQRMEEPSKPSWDNLDPAGAPFSGDADGALAAHVWNWLAGRKDTGGNGGNGAKAELLETLRDADETRRLSSAYALAAIGEEAVPDLIKALADEARDKPESDTGKWPTNPQGENPAELNAAYALSATGQSAVPHLVDALHDNQWEVRAAAADVLGNIGPGARPATVDLAQSLADENFWVRRNAAEALGTIAEPDDSAIAALAAALSDGDHRIRRNATLSLAKIGTAAGAAVSSLRPILADENRYVRYNGFLALKRIGTPEAQSALVDELLAARWCPLTTVKTPY